MIELVLLSVVLIIMVGVVFTPLFDNLFDYDDEDEGDEQHRF